MRLTRFLALMPLLLLSGCIEELPDPAPNLDYSPRTTGIVERPASEA